MKRTLCDPTSHFCHHHRFINTRLQSHSTQNHHTFDLHFAEQPESPNQPAPLRSHTLLKAACSTSLQHHNTQAAAACNLSNDWPLQQRLRPAALAAVQQARSWRALHAAAAAAASSPPSSQAAAGPACIAGVRLSPLSKALCGSRSSNSSRRRSNTHPAATRTTAAQTGRRTSSSHRAPGGIPFCAATPRTRSRGIAPARGGRSTTRSPRACWRSAGVCAVVLGLWGAVVVALRLCCGGCVGVGFVDEGGSAV